LPPTDIASASAPRGVEPRVLAVVDAFVSELGSTPVRGRVAPDDVLDRDLGVGSLERVEPLARLGRSGHGHAPSPRGCAPAGSSAARRSR
jgi:hypothetical protein